jgi:acetoin utilization protein AcuB
MNITTIMTVGITKISPHSSFREAKDILDAAPFHHLLVEEDGKLVGIISDQDIKDKIAGFALSSTTVTYAEFEAAIRVADIMTSEMWVIDVDTPIDAASILILENNISCLPVVDAKMAIEGIVTWKDFLKHFVYL